MGSLIARVVGWGVPAKLAKPFIFAMGLGIAVLLFFGAKALYDASVVDNYKNKVEASQAKADRKADEKAAEQRRTDDARAAKERQELNDVATDPKLDARERRVALYRCIRLQQAARADGKQPPACN